MNKTPVTVDKNGFPREFRIYFENAKIYDSSCSSDMRVYYVDKGFYIKTAKKDALKNEAEAGERFYALGIGVEIMDYISTDMDYLVTREAEGTDLTHCLDKPEMICGVLAEALKELHVKPYGNINVSPAYAEYTELADNCDNKSFKSKAIAQVLGISDRDTAITVIKNNKDRFSADTLIHGDACLPNVIQKDGKFSTFIDFAMSGVGDKHMDLYWAIWSLWFNLKTDSYTDLLLDLYGRDNYDHELLRTVAALETLYQEEI
ncbi:MAG: aminoglycoside 3'-phosphotransferase [Ruminococcaceae bacterium]|nr:aminoglycoside 3'-phosphotransferase [Oscillospiraceae bacterium]